MVAPLTSTRRPGMTPATTVARLATGPKTTVFLHATMGRFTLPKQRSWMPPCSLCTDASSYSKTHGRG
jgi:hypothetical protein